MLTVRKPTPSVGCRFFQLSGHLPLGNWNRQLAQSLHTRLPHCSVSFAMFSRSNCLFLSKMPVVSQYHWKLLTWSYFAKSTHWLLQSSFISSFDWPRWCCSIISRSIPLPSSHFKAYIFYSIAPFIRCHWIQDDHTRLQRIIDNRRAVKSCKNVNILLKITFWRVLRWSELWNMKLYITTKISLYI